ncbi:MAG: hypothetical protein V9F06_03225 [Thermomicrobiales bacterium]
MRRNAKFEAGELTLHISPQMVYSVPGCYEGVLRGTATYHSLAAGASCKEPWECGSGLCSGGVCRTCSAKRKCPGKFDVCLEGGVCRMATPPNQFVIEQLERREFVANVRRLEAQGPGARPNVLQGF